MDIRPQLQQTQSQKLILSPQIRQFLRLLQMPSLELHEAINQELSLNPAIEEAKDERESETASTDEPAGEPTVAEDENNLSPEELDLQKKLDDLDKLDDTYRASSKTSNTSGESLEDLEQKQAYRQSLITKTVTLTDHLESQSQFLNLTSAEKQVFQYIVGNITADGYLSVTLEEVAAATSVPAAEAEKILTLVQQMDPPGVAARSLQECLLIQLRRMENPETRLAEKIIANHLELLEKRKFAPLARALKVTEAQVMQAVKLIGRLEPKPGRTFAALEAIAVTPDVRVVEDEATGRFRAELIDDFFPRIRISPQYRRMLRDKKLDKNTKEYLRERIHSGLWFMNAMEQRKSTLQNIASAIVDIQSDYMRHGPSHLKPLRMKDIATQVGIHESTVSRAIQGKYMSAPHGTVPMKSFFSNSLDTQDGGTESQTSIMEKIKALVEHENPAKPLSDQKIVALLKEDNAKVARRTVAKYRDMLRILPSHLRKKDSA